MGFSSRQIMMRSIYSLFGLIVIEIILLGSMIVVVPDLPQRHNEEKGVGDFHRNL